MIMSLFLVYHARFLLQTTAQLNPDDAARVELMRYMEDTGGNDRDCPADSVCCPGSEVDTEKEEESPSKRFCHLSKSLRKR